MVYGKLKGNLLSLAFFAICMGFLGCGREVEPAEGELVVAVSICPYASLVKRILGERGKVVTLLPPGLSPETFDPQPRHIASLFKARVYFKTLFPWEERLAAKVRSQTSKLQVIELCEELPLRKLDDGQVNERKGGSPDPHLWLDPVLVSKQCERLASALQGIDRSAASYYQRNATKLKEDLLRLHKEIVLLLKPFKGRAFLAVHPSFGYFADRYGLKQISLEEEGKELTAKRLSEVIEIIKLYKIKAILSQREFPRASAKRLSSSLGLKLVEVDLLGKSWERSYEEGLRSVVKAVLKVVSEIR